MRSLSMLLVGAMLAGMIALPAEAQPDNLRISMIPRKGKVAKKSGRIDVPVIRPVGKYYFENNPVYGQYYRTHQYRMSHYDGNGNVD